MVRLGIPTCYRGHGALRTSLCPGGTPITAPPRTLPSRAIPAPTADMAAGWRRLRYCLRYRGSLPPTIPVLKRRGGLLRRHYTLPRPTLHTPPCTSFPSTTLPFRAPHVRALAGGRAATVPLWTLYANAFTTTFSVAGQPVSCHLTLHTMNSFFSLRPAGRTHTAHTSRHAIPPTPHPWTGAVRFGRHAGCVGLRT